MDRDLLNCSADNVVELTWARHPDEHEQLIGGKPYLDLKFSILCCYFSALTWVLFDYGLTLHDEVRHIWRRPMRAGTILFYAIRYLGSAALAAGIGIYFWPEYAYLVPVAPIDPSATPLPMCPPGPNTKVLWNGVQPTGSVVSSGVVAIQLFIFWAVEARIFALYNSRRLAIFNGVIFTLGIVMGIFLWLFLPVQLHLGFVFEHFHRKAGHNSNDFQTRLFALYWVPGIIFEAWLGGLALAKLRPKILKHDLLTVLVHDSIKYFGLIALVMVVHTISIVNDAGQYGIPFAIAGQTIGGSRLFLHLRRAYFRNQGRDTTGISRPNLSFALPTADDPARKPRWVDETFYVDDDVGDYFEDVDPSIGPEDVG